MALSLENSERQARTMESQESAVEFVNGVRPKQQKFRNFSATSKKTEGTCWACGSSKHNWKDPSCPAKGKKCHLCSNIGHFEKCCLTKVSHVKKPVKSDRQKYQKKHYVKSV